MKEIFAFSLFLCFVSISHAQKKLILATKSTVTDIDLPTGSKQDGRVLSQSVAGFLMETESDKRKTKLQTAEVLILPPASVSKFNKDSLVQRLSSKHWKIIATEGDKYLWLQQDKRFVIAFFSIDTKEVSVYFAETITVPDFSEHADNTISNQPAIQSIQDTDKAAIPGNANINSPLVGIWRRGKGVTGYGGRWSSTGYQYTFNANGTYTYIRKTYVEDDPETLLTRESGIYTLSENTVTLDPGRNVIEAWSKSNGGDNYRALITTQDKPLEKITYQFSIQFVPELKETGLFLIYRTETARDGKYNGTDAFPNGWRFSPSGPDYKPIKMPGE